MMKKLESIKYSASRGLEILDQLKIPESVEYIPVESVEDGWNVIRNMQVRGAPAIAIVGALSIASELHNQNVVYGTKEEFAKHVIEKFDYLVTARPTAINLRNARDEMEVFLKGLVDDPEETPDSLTLKYCRYSIEAQSMLRKDLHDNKAVGKFGADAILATLAPEAKVSVLTHCNTGSLATAGYGTALGIIRNLHEEGRLEMAYYTETRPYNQGARLTSFELMFEDIPATLICDSMAGWLMKAKNIDAVITGADHVTLSGDVANKIGTYSLAVLAKHHDIPVYVASPTTSFDPRVLHGDHVKIEERPGEEMTKICGHQIAAPGTKCWNLAFDVTPAELVTGGIVTEFGVFRPEKLEDAYKFGWK